MHRGMLMADLKNFANGKLAEAHAKALELHGRQSEVVKISADNSSSVNFAQFLGHPAGYVAPADNGPQFKPPGKSA